MLLDLALSLSTPVLLACLYEILQLADALIYLCKILLDDERELCYLDRSIVKQRLSFSH